jgi:hypothetical protein
MQENLPAVKTQVIENAVGKRIINPQEAEQLKMVEAAESKRLLIEEQLARARAQALISTN